MSIPGLPTGPQPVEVDGEMVLYGDGRTSQSFKDETDINKLLVKAQRAGTLSHLQKHGAYYADVSDVDDLMVAYQRVNRAQEVFDELPSEIRREFHNSWSDFYKYVNDPSNKDRLPQLLPGLAAPGRQHISPGQGRSEPGGAPVQPVVPASSSAPVGAPGSDPAAPSSPT